MFECLGELCPKLAAHMGKKAIRHIITMRNIVKHPEKCLPPYRDLVRLTVLLLSLM